MKITLQPQRSDDILTVVKAGDTLSINGEDFDFSVIPDGAALPAEAVDCSYITDKIERIDGELSLTLLLPHGSDASEAARFPEPIFNPVDGPVELPQ